MMIEIPDKGRVGTLISQSVKQSFGKIWVQKARGVDSFKNHSYAKRPKKTMDKKDIIFRKSVNLKLSEIFYANSKQKGKY